MIYSLLLIPTLCAALVFFSPAVWIRRVLLLGGAVAHLALVITCWITRPFVMDIAATANAPFVGLDPLGLLFLTITSVLFLMSSIYSIAYLQWENTGHHDEIEDAGFFHRAPDAVFMGCLLGFLAITTLVTVSRHFGLLWVAVEATTLVTVPLIIFHRNKHSLEAAWKYLILCSVGIALALLGTYCLAVAAGGGKAALTVDALRYRNFENTLPWLKAAFILFLVGYGAKMGLAPMHAWLPDAHSEAPSSVSMLLSGALLNCALLAVLRLFQVCLAAGLADFARELLIVFGLFALGIAGVFLLRQVEYKRMLAYSSVEHIGIIVLGLGLGGVGEFGGLYHAINHSLTKGMLFLLAGNVLAAYQTRCIRDVHGMRRKLPWTGMLWLLGFFAITGAPPFGLFMSEFTILRASLAHHWLVPTLYLGFLALVFIGMATSALGMAQGEDMPVSNAPEFRETFSVIAPPLLLACLTLLLGVYCPAPVAELLREASVSLGGSATW
jgi:hydrogenase-4 component F